MEKLKEFYDMIDFIYLSIIIIGGEFWAKKYFTPFKESRYNFLLYSTLFAAVWILVLVVVEKFTMQDLPNFLVTYVVATSFYEIIAEKVFRFIHSKFKV